MKRPPGHFTHLPGALSFTLRHPTSQQQYWLCFTDGEHQDFLPRQLRPLGIPVCRGLSSDSFPDSLAFKKSETGSVHRVTEREGRYEGLVLLRAAKKRGRRMREGRFELPREPRQILSLVRLPIPPLSPTFQGPGRVSRARHINSGPTHCQLKAWR